MFERVLPVGVWVATASGTNAWEFDGGILTKKGDRRAGHLARVTKCVIGHHVGGRLLSDVIFSIFTVHEFYR